MQIAALKKILNAYSQKLPAHNRVGPRRQAARETDQVIYSLAGFAPTAFLWQIFSSIQGAIICPDCLANAIRALSN